MSEEKAPYGNHVPEVGKKIEPRIENSNYGEFATIKTECLCENHSQLKSVAEEMAEALQSLLKNRTYKPAQSALEKYNKLKENE